MDQERHEESDSQKRPVCFFCLVFISLKYVELWTMKAPGEVAKFTHEINNFYVIVKL